MISALRERWEAEKEFAGYEMPNAEPERRGGGERLRFCGFFRAVLRSKRDVNCVDFDRYPFSNAAVNKLM